MFGDSTSSFSKKCRNLFLGKLNYFLIRHHFNLSLAIIAFKYFELITM